MDGLYMPKFSIRFAHLSGECSLFAKFFHIDYKNDCS